MRARATTWWVEVTHKLHKLKNIYYIDIMIADTFRQPNLVLKVQNTYNKRLQCPSVADGSYKCVILVPQQTRNVNPMLFQRWAVATLAQHWYHIGLTPRVCWGIMFDTSPGMSGCDSSGISGRWRGTCGCWWCIITMSCRRRLYHSEDQLQPTH